MAAIETRTSILYCFPCAGGSALTYLHWRKHLPTWIDVRPVELPGRGARGREPLVRSFDEMVERLTEELALGSLRNYAFFGHSLGALLAYGCAHRLRELGRNLPSAFIAACSSAPSRRDDARLALLNSDEKLICELRRLKGTPEDVFGHEELLRMTLDLLAADFAVCADFVFRPRDPLTLDIVAVGGRDDSIEEHALSAWGAETTRGAKVEMFDGGHFFFKEQEERFLAYLATQLQTIARSPPHMRSN